MFKDSAVVTRSQLLAQGLTRGYIDHAVATGRLIRLHRGVYVDSSAVDLPKSMMLAHLVACGPEAVLSHNSAAELHGFDSTLPYENVIHISAPRSCGVRSEPPGLFIAYSTMLKQREVIDELPVTTRARTLLDMAARVDDVECERILEAALRSSNPKRPDRWRTEALDNILSLLTKYPRHPGASRVRRVLHLRPAGCRPTGSFAETVLVQALRRVGIEMIRQPTLIVLDEAGRRFEYFPDGLIVAGRCIVEVDGSQHLLPQRARSDSARQNRLVGFTVFRYPATTILNDVTYAVNELAAHVRHVQNQQLSWTDSGRAVSGACNNWSIAPMNVQRAS
jgi:very-short-patch-repair endonuclease